MPAVELPNGQSAIIYSKDEISERVSRRISRAYLKAAGTASKLVTLGFDESNPSTWGAISELSDDDQTNLDGYQAELIAGFVRSWTLGDAPTVETALDLPKSTFEALAQACAEEFNHTEEFGPDGVTDPKAPTAD